MGKKALGGENCSMTRPHLLTGKTTPALAERLTRFFLTFPALPDMAPLALPLVHGHRSTTGSSDLPLSLSRPTRTWRLQIAVSRSRPVRMFDSSVGVSGDFRRMRVEYQMITGAEDVY